jgi:capsular polysaccharide transport system permease protein
MVAQEVIAKLARALNGQFEVLHALIMRETRTRYGAHQAGYAWALVEPVLMILTFYGVFVIAGRGVQYGMDLLGFLCTGLIPYMVFSNSTTQVSQSINGNKSLLFYPQVKPLDVVFARSILEFCTNIGVFLVLMTANVLYQQELHIHDPLLIVIGFVLASLLGTGLGLVFCGLSQLSNVADRARGPIIRPFFWCSGIFFAANSLPEGLPRLLLYNPVLHAVELIRAGWYPSYDANYVDIPYVLFWILGLFLVGLSLEIVVRRRIEVT